jgi:7-keto-8-aminopelargonate synthetase-like enzyme/predicted N-acyltransferase
MATKTSKHAELIETIQEIASIGKERGLLHQYTEDYSYNGREIHIEGKKLINFGSCSYLGLEIDQRIKDGAIDAIERYGSQLACSRAFLSNTLYKEFEDALRKMFNAPLLLAPTTSVGHQAVMPTVVEDTDAIVLDQQAHWSMQDVAYKLQVRGITVTKIRHSRLDELEAKINELSAKHTKIWYFIDGIYSMYGDPAPLKELVLMMNKHNQLHLYVDDAHGVSWAGKNGTGYTLSQIDLHPKMIFATSLGKAFANVGGVFVFPNEELCWKVKSWGGLLSQSGPQPPAVLGACLSTAKIHLSDEIYERQKALAEKIKYCNKLLLEKGLPLVSDSPAPIFFVGLGLPKVGYNMVNRLIEDGIYVNLAVFPVVPETCTGIRFALTLHHTSKDIERLVDRLAYHLPLALEEENRTLDDIYKAFKSLKHLRERPQPTLSVEKINENENFTIQKERSISKIDKYTWNNLFKDKGAFDYDALLLYEEVFNNNDKPEDQWDFYYYLVRDKSGEVVLATFFTKTLTKNDMLSSASVSKRIEEKRINDPYYQTSKTLIMGTMLTEGNHLYINRSKNNWKPALSYFVDSIAKEHDQNKQDLFLIRDLDANDKELRDFFIDHGFIKINMPDAHSVNIPYKTKEEFIESLPAKKRKSVKVEILEFENFYEVRFANEPLQQEIEHWYRLYENVYSKSLELNVFKLPKKLFFKIANDPNWDIIELKLKKEFLHSTHDLTVAVGFIYKGNDNYFPVTLGIDYNFIEQYNVYKQLLFQAVMRGAGLKKKTIHLGFMGSMEKRKLGAVAEHKIGFVRVKDDFDISLIGMMPE